MASSPNHSELFFPTVLEISSGFCSFRFPKLWCELLGGILVARGEYQQWRSAFQTIAWELISQDGSHLFEFTGHATGISITAIAQH